MNKGGDGKRLLYRRTRRDSRVRSDKVAAVAILSQTELSVQQHLDLAPSLLSYSDAITGEEDELLMMAQPVPHQSPTDKKRVKVYELRNNDWFDRGTGFCAAAFVPVSILVLRLRRAL